MNRRTRPDYEGGCNSDSEGPGRGSEYVVRLPVVVEASGPQAADERGEPSVPKPGLRILVVDDNRDGSDSLAMMLRVMGNDTRTAYGGEERVDVAEKVWPDVILFDIGLPIAVTGWGQDEDHHRSHEAGFDHHLVKPVDPNALTRLLAWRQRDTRSPSSTGARRPLFSLPARSILGDRHRLDDHAEEFRNFSPDMVVDMIPFTEQDAGSAVATFRGVAGRLVTISSGDVYRASGVITRLEQAPLEPTPIEEGGSLRQVLFPYRAGAKPGDDKYVYEKILVERVVLGTRGRPPPCCGCRSAVTRRMELARSARTSPNARRNRRPLWMRYGNHAVMTFQVSLGRRSGVSPYGSRGSGSPGPTPFGGPAGPGLPTDRTPVPRRGPRRSPTAPFNSLSAPFNFETPVGGARKDKAGEVNGGWPGGTQSGHFRSKLRPV